MILNTGNILLIGSILLFSSILISKAGVKLGVPALLLFLLVGMAFGTDGIGVEFSSPAATQFIGVLALSVILFSGGMDTSYRDIKPVIGPGVVLATLGVMLTTLLTGFFIYYITGLLSDYATLSLMESMLLAAVMSSTDSASVFSILRSKGMGLKENLRPTLELESGSNDPMAYMLTLLLIQVIQSGDFSLSGALLMLVVQLCVGAIAGYLLGQLTTWIINRININNASLYPVLLLGCVFFIFSFTEVLKGNGYLAVYIAGLVVGNHKVVHKKSLGTFFDGFAWLFQIVMFLTLGLLVNPSELVSIAGIGILVAVFMIVAARPASVFISLIPFRKFSTKARLYISWVGLRGAVPIIFATYPWLAGIEHSRMMFNIVFFITIVSLLLQGMTVSSMARWLGLETDGEKKRDFDVDLPEEIKTAMSEIEVVPNALNNGNRLMNLSLPPNTLVVMVKRDGHYFVPTGQTTLQVGDKLLVISDNDEELKKTFRELGIDDYSILKN